MKNKIIAGAGALIVLTVGSYGIQWQFSSSADKLSPKEDIELCIRDKYSMLGEYTTTFKVTDPKGKTFLKKIKGSGDDWVCVMFPRNFKEAKFYKGKYSWKSIVRKKSVASGNF